MSVIRLLVLSDNSTNYHRVFEKVLSKKVRKPNQQEPPSNENCDRVGPPALDFIMEQASLANVHLSHYDDPSGLVVDLQPEEKPLANTNQHKFRVFKPTFVLIRNIVHGAGTSDYRNVLYGFMHANIPSINSLLSVFCSTERPVVHAELRRIQHELGADRFPLVPQNYYSKPCQMNFMPPYPIVLKVGHVHAGLGKMKLENDEQMKDVKSILAIHDTDYCTAEPFITGQYDIRIQKIGSLIRAYRRLNFHGWKGNVGTALLEDIPVEDRYRLWVEKASEMFGGMEILAVDVIVEEKTNKEYILEVNDCSIGLGPEHEEEDLEYMAELVLERAQNSQAVVKPPPVTLTPSILESTTAAPPLRTVPVRDIKTPSSSPPRGHRFMTRKDIWSFVLLTVQLLLLVLVPVLLAVYGKWKVVA